LEITETVILHDIDPLFTLSDSLVTEIRLARGFPGVFPRYSPT
jgi:hypothetical protein